MALRLFRSNRFVALLLVIDAVLSSLYIKEVIYAIPFAIAAFEFYMAPLSWQLRRWLMFFTVVVVLLSLLFGMNLILEGFPYQGISLFGLNALILAQFVVILRKR